MKGKFLDRWWFRLQVEGDLAQRTVLTMVIIVDPPGFDLDTCILQRFKLVTVHVFVPKTPDKALNIRIFNGFSRSC